MGGGVTQRKSALPVIFIEIYLVSFSVQMQRSGVLGWSAMDGGPTTRAIQFWVVGPTYGGGLSMRNLG